VGTSIDAIWQLDRNRLRRHVDRLCLIDREAFGEQAWGRDSFCRLLPGKFQLSRIALHNSIPIGYLIGSRYDSKWSHIHRIVVASSFHRKGIATRLLERFEDACLAVEIAELTLESLVTRDAANAFYERTGFTRVSGGRLVEYLERKGKTEMKHRYVGPSDQGDVIVYGKRLA